MRLGVVEAYTSSGASIALARIHHADPARRGVESATMEMIAREAKVAVGTIYLHFASRDEV
ncbi:MAG TPA: helix-turn-helix domain-containing protein, partial [Candidatus Binataceae bacterium]|nr:helix-turn-helix domain-containing protein [Candidatus Binataceae bacterium]